MSGIQGNMGVQVAGVVPGTCFCSACFTLSVQEVPGPLVPTGSLGRLPFAMYDDDCGLMSSWTRGSLLAAAHSLQRWRCTFRKNNTVSLAVPWGGGGGGGAAQQGPACRPPQNVWWVRTP